MLAVLLLGTGMPVLPQQEKGRSKGTLSFRYNNQLYVADSSHARAYVLKSDSTAFISGSNSENMVMDVQWKHFKAAGNYTITMMNGKAEFTIEHKTYTLSQNRDFVKVTVASVKTAGSFLLLTGSFEALLHDKNGNAVPVKEGKFTTYTL